MTTNPDFRSFTCLSCRESVPTAAVQTTCPDCGGVLTATYDLADRSPAELLASPPRPIAPHHRVSIDEGETPATACPPLAEELGVDRLLIKDEGRNPTGAVTDRGLASAVSGAVAADAPAVALPTTGNGGQSAAALAGRANLESHSFVPSRCPFVNKAMINVHGGEMTVVEGRYPDAVAAYEQETTEDWFAVGPASPYRRDGVKTLYYELLADLDGERVDAVVVPVGHGIVLAAVHAAVAELQAAGRQAAPPRLYAVQPAGCSPVVEAVRSGGEVAVEPQPDTIVGALEVPDPAVGSLAVAAVEETDGDAVSVADSEALQAAVDAAQSTGLELSATGGVALAGARSLASEFDDDATVVLVNPIAGSKEDDLLRSHLMSQGL